MTNDLAIKILMGDVLGTTEQTHEAVAMAVKALSALPSADVAEVVRCKDCKNAEERGCALFCGFWSRYTAHKGYCFKAERWEDG